MKTRKEADTPKEYMRKFLIVELSKNIDIYQQKTPHDIPTIIKNLKNKEYEDMDFIVMDILNNLAMFNDITPQGYEIVHKINNKYILSIHNKNKESIYHFAKRIITKTYSYTIV
jgi:hypothetical protein